MPTIRLCPSCEQLLATASDAIRRHAEEMHTAISVVPTGLTEPQVDEYKTKLIESFGCATHSRGLRMCGSRMER